MDAATAGQIILSDPRARRWAARAAAIAAALIATPLVVLLALRGRVVGLLLAGHGRERRRDSRGLRADVRGRGLRLTTSTPTSSPRCTRPRATTAAIRPRSRPTRRVRSGRCSSFPPRGRAFATPTGRSPPSGRPAIRICARRTAASPTTSTRSPPRPTTCTSSAPTAASISARWTRSSATRARLPRRSHTRGRHSPSRSSSKPPT